MLTDCPDRRETVRAFFDGSKVTRRPDESPYSRDQNSTSWATDAANAVRLATISRTPGPSFLTTTMMKRFDIETSANLGGTFRRIGLSRGFGRLFGPGKPRKFRYPT